MTSSREAIILKNGCKFGIFLIILLFLSTYPISAQRLPNCVKKYHVAFWYTDSTTSEIAKRELTNLQEELEDHGINLVIDRIHGDYKEHRARMNYLSSKGLLLTAPYFVTEEGDIFVYGDYREGDADDYAAKALILQRIIDKGLYYPCDFPEEAIKLTKKSKSFLQTYAKVLNETVLIEYNFNRNTEGFVETKLNYSLPIRIDNENDALKINVNYTGNKTNEIVIAKTDFIDQGLHDWSQYSTLSFDVFIPKEAAKDILISNITTIGNYSTDRRLTIYREWIPMTTSTMIIDRSNPNYLQEEEDSTDIIPGKWNAIERDISKIKKDNVIALVIKIKFNGEKDYFKKNKSYSGPVYIDKLKIWSDKFDFFKPGSYNKIVKAHVYIMRSAPDLMNARISYQYMKLALGSIFREEEKGIAYQKKIQMEPSEEEVVKRTKKGIEVSMTVPRTRYSEGDILETGIKVSNLKSAGKTNTNSIIYLAENTTCNAPLSTNEFDFDVAAFRNERFSTKYALNKAGTYHVIVKTFFDNDQILLNQKITVEPVFEPKRNILVSQLKDAENLEKALSKKGYNTEEALGYLKKAHQKITIATSLHEKCDYSNAMEELNEAQSDLTFATIRLNLISSLPIPEVDNLKYKNWIVVYGKKAPYSDKKVAFELATKMGFKVVSDQNITLSEIRDKNVVLIGGPDANSYSNLFKTETCSKFEKIDDNWYIISDCNLIDDEGYGFYSKTFGEVYLVAGLSRWGTISAYNKFVKDEVWKGRNKGFKIRLSDESGNPLNDLTISLGDPKSGESERYKTDENGYILDWLILSPYNNDIDPKIAPNPNDGPLVSACCEKIYWREVHSSSEFVNTHNHISSDNFASYAFIYLYSPESQKINLIIENEGKKTLWLNEVEESTEEVTLQMGWNKLLFKLY